SFARALPNRPPHVAGVAYLVTNVRTGEVLLKHAQRRQVPIASITKLMTVLVTLEHAHLDDLVTVNPTAAGIGEESIGLVGGEQLSVGELVEGALIQSA